MILDKVKNLELYKGLVPETVISRLAPGRYEIQGNDVYALVQEYPTRARSEGRWEAHRDYIDVHIMVRGEELVGFANVADLESLGDYDSAKDAEHFTGDGIFFTLKEGYFAIFGTSDAHMPCLQPNRPNTVRKIVLKIRAR